MAMTIKELNDVLNIIERNRKKVRKIIEFQERLNELIDEIEREELKVEMDHDGVIFVTNN